MNKSAYQRPNKPRLLLSKRRERINEAQPAPLPEPVAVDRATECHVTPPAVAARMVDYLGLPDCGYTLEPSAGTGSIVKALIARGHQVQAVERHHKLSAILAELLPDYRVSQDCFLDWAQDAPRYERIVMNPPFRQVRKHIDAALSILDPLRGVLVALVPITYNHPRAVELETLPADTFARATVNTKIIQISGGYDA